MFPIRALDPSRANKRSRVRSWAGAYGVSAVAHGIALLGMSIYFALPTKSFRVTGTTQAHSIEMVAQTSKPTAGSSVLVESNDLREELVTPSDLTPQRQPQLPNDLGTRPFFPKETIPSDQPNRVDAHESPAFETPPTAKVSVGRTHRMPALQQRAGYESGPDLSRNTPPEYPLDAIRRRLQGVVLLRLLIDEEGTVRLVKLVKSSGHRILDQAAIDAVASWTGTPAKRNGHPVDALEVLPIRFRL